MKTLKQISIAILLTTSLNAFAEDILIQSPGASPTSFNEVAQNTKGITTYTDLQISRARKNSLQEETLFRLSDQLDRPTSDILKSLESIQSQAPLTETSLHFVHDLSEKLLTHPLSVSDARTLKVLNCKSAMLTEQIYPESCKTLKVDFQAIHRQWPQAQTLMVETQTFAIDGTTYPNVLPLTNYHWTLLSNSQKPLHYYGTYEGFLQQAFAMENLVDGSCEGFSNNIDDFEVSSQALVFFSKECTKKLAHIEQKTSFATWIENNKKWVYPTAGLLLGGAIIAAQGKTIVIDKP